MTFKDATNATSNMLSHIIGIFGICLLLSIIAVSPSIYSGVVNVAAKEPHAAFVRWFLQTAKTYSVQHHADANVKTPDLNDSSFIEAGYEHYRETCVSCHGAPGVPRSDVGK